MANRTSAELVEVEDVLDMVCSRDGDYHDGLDVDVSMSHNGDTAHVTLEDDAGGVKKFIIYVEEA